MGPRRFVIALTALLCGCGLVIGPASASCAFFIEWNGVPYDAENFHQTIPVDASLGKATVPPCDDDGSAGCQHDEGDEIAISRVSGVDPHIAVAGAGEVFLARGFFPQLPDHPLHEAAFGSVRRPNEQAGWRCGAPMTDLVGPVIPTPGLGW